MDIEGNIFGALVIIFLALYCWASVNGAPWLPTRMKKVRQMLNLAEIQPGEVVYDLGCGDGRFLVIAARKFGAYAVGIELNPIFYLWCQMLITILGLRGRVKIVYGNFFKHDLSNADVIICYLLQDTNDRLEFKLLKELKPSARVCSNSFVFDNLPVISEDRRKEIYIYKTRF
jgi:SAM-dependent methyltransferase